jgi:hypothetical protein
MIDTAYDVLGLEAVFLVPRIFSLLSLNPYFGTLVSGKEFANTFPLPCAIWVPAQYSNACVSFPGARIRQRHLVHG